MVQRPKAAMLAQSKARGASKTEHGRGEARLKTNPWHADSTQYDPQQRRALPRVIGLY